jgi:hypothetical protein
MRDLSHFPGTLAVLKRHQWVCLFLVFSLLYNPFLAAPRTTGGLEVTHPASHRATVGSSELKHFTFATGQSLLAFVDLALVEAPLPLPVPSGTNSLRVFPELYPPDQLLCASLWFRPPPAS